MSVTYTCSSGYRLLPADEHTITCTDDGSWSGDLGGCYSGKKVLCFDKILKFFFV